MQSEERILAGVAGVSNAIADFVQGLKHGTKKAHVKGIGCFREPENPDKLQTQFPYRAKVRVTVRKNFTSWSLTRAEASCCTQWPTLSSSRFPTRPGRPARSFSKGG